ncbi:relaxase/mobilization nuclease domain-containing protein [Clostridium estertheticum]|nr:relaxase/mobilization nuclease domain-containing protein [Clostridium estertheticum]
MVGTKELYGKTGGRQGYHIVISCPPGEGTPEQLLALMKEFAHEFLGDDYEAVYSVHVDKEHCHGHLVFNSVNMDTGKKYGLSIMPAEYSKNPVNMNRKQWEKEKSWSEFIEADVKYCRGMQKTYTIDFLTKKKVMNNGYVKKYYVRNSHEAIISKELY